MPIPTQFSALTNATGAELDANFAFVGLLGNIPCTALGTNTITLTPTAQSIAILSYQNNLTLSFVPAGANTGAVVVNLAGLGNINVYKDGASGPIALTGGEFQPANLVRLSYDATLNSGNGGMHVDNLLSNTTVSYNITSSPNISTSPTGNPTSGPLLATYASLNIQAAAGKAGNREFLVEIGLTSNLGAGQSNGNGDKVALYIGTVGSTGSGNLWNINTVLQADNSGGTYPAFVWEADIINNNPTCTMAGIALDGRVSGGATIAYGFQLGAALGLTTQCFSNGIVMPGIISGTDYSPIAAAGAALWDFGNSGSTTIRIWGNHTHCMDFAGLTTCTTGLAFAGANISQYGIDFNNSVATQAAIRLGNGQRINARRADNAADVIMTQLDSSNNMLMGSNDVASMFVSTAFNSGFAPLQDSWTDCGLPFLAWGTVFSHAYSTVSDPSLKKDMAPLPTAASLVKGLELISYDMADGSNDKRRWGFDATNVRRVFEGAGIESNAWDVTQVDGVDRHTIGTVPLLALALKHCQELEARVTTLEGGRA